MTIRLSNAVLLLLTFVIVMPEAFSQAKGMRDADTTLHRYIELRLNSADWNAYSKLITWPDEPGWDCWWVAKDYTFGPTNGNSDRVVIPVTYKRLELFCVDAQFKPGEETDTIKYELVRKHVKWKIDGPIPDYPYLSLLSVKNDLSRTISDTNESPERRARAREALASIEKMAK